MGLNSFSGPWTQQTDLGLARRFRIGERQSITFQVQAFSVLNHANFCVQNGNAVSQIQYLPLRRELRESRQSADQPDLLPGARIAAPMASERCKESTR